MPLEKGLKAAQSHFFINRTGHVAPKWRVAGKIALK